MLSIQQSAFLEKDVSLPVCVRPIAEQDCSARIWPSVVEGKLETL